MFERFANTANWYYVQRDSTMYFDLQNPHFQRDSISDLRG